MANIKIPATHTSFFLALLFIFLGFSFATFRGYVSRVNRALLYSSGEVKAQKPQKTLRETELEQIIKQSKDVTKIITGKAPLPAKKGSASTAQKAYHANRKEPPKDAFYIESDDEEGSDIPKDALLYVTEHKQAVYHPEFWEGQPDCAAVGWVKKMSDGLLVTVEVTDDELKADAARPWECDSVELYFDFRSKASRGKDNYEKGVFQAIALPCFANSNGNTVSFYAGGGEVRPVPGAKMKSYVRPDGKGYTVKVFLPFSGLKTSHFLPSADFSFDFAINDLDSGGRSQHMWSGTVDNCRAPQFFGRMTPYSRKR